MKNQIYIEIFGIFCPITIMTEKERFESENILYSDDPEIQKSLDRINLIKKSQVR